MSSSVTMTFEIEVELQDAFVELGLEAVAFLDLPLSVDDSEGDVFIRGASMEPDSHGIGGSVRLEEELGSCCFVEQFGVEDVEFVALDDLWRRVFTVVVSLVVFVPLVALLDWVEETGFAPDLLRDGFKAIFTEEFALFGRDDIGEFLLVGTKSFILGLLEHL